MPAPPSPPATLKPPIPNDSLQSSPRQVFLSATYITANAPVKLALYGSGPSRTIVLLTAGILVYKPSSPAYDGLVSGDGVGSDVVSLPTLPVGTALDVSAQTLETGTTADVLVMF